MGNLGAAEMLVIFLLALIVLGPDRLPKAARQIGQVVRQVRRMSSGFQDEIRTAFDDHQPSSSVQSEVDQERRRLAAVPDDKVVTDDPPEMETEVVARADDETGHSPDAEGGAERETG